MASFGRHERSINIWPGFVDALATLLMVIIFLLLIFVLAQFFLGQALSGRDSALQRLESQVSELADLLSLEKLANKNLTENLAQISEQLRSSVADRDDLNATVSLLRATLGEREVKMEKMFRQILSDKEELRRQELEIASLGQDVDALRALRAELETQVSNLATRAAMLRDAINKERDVRASIERKLSDAKGTISITVEELEAVKHAQAKTKAELEASQAARQSTLDELETSRQLLGDSRSALDAARATLLKERDLSKSAQAQIALLNQQMSALRRQLANLEQALEVSETLSEEQKVQIYNLGKRLNAALASKLQKLSRYRSEFFGQLRDVLGRQQGIRIVGDRFVFQSEVLFDKGSAEIGKPGQEQVAALAATLRNIAKKIPKGIDWVLRVDGHTDSDPISTVRFPSNWELSSARAISVVQSLITNGLPPKRLVAAGFGEFQPIDQKTDEIAKRRNRRIELKLTQR